MDKILTFEEYTLWMLSRIARALIYITILFQIMGELKTGYLPCKLIDLNKRGRYPVLISNITFKPVTTISGRNSLSMNFVDYFTSKPIQSFSKLLHSFVTYTFSLHYHQYFYSNWYLVIMILKLLQQDSFLVYNKH